MTPRDVGGGPHRVLVFLRAEVVWLLRVAQSAGKAKRRAHKVGVIGPIDLPRFGEVLARQRDGFVVPFRDAQILHQHRFGVERLRMQRTVKTFQPGPRFLLELHSPIEVAPKVRGVGEGGQAQGGRV